VAQGIGPEFKSQYQREKNPTKKPPPRKDYLHSGNFSVKDNFPLFNSKYIY
jgi:hypothetical protein